MTYFEVVGKYFGYPECCIKQFEKDSNPAKRAVGDTGFIPCDKHFKLIKKGKITLKSLISNRICPHIFPKQGNNEEIQLWVDRNK